MSRIRVAHVIETVHLGGVEQTRLALARGLDPDQFEQILICTKALGALPDEFALAGCPVHAVGTFQSRIDWAVIGRVRAILRQFKPDIVHGAVFEGVVAAVFAGRLERVPIIIGEETADPMGRRLGGHSFFVALCMLCTRVVAVSPFVETYLRDKLRLSWRKVVLINNGVITTEETSRDELRMLRCELGLSDSHFVIGTVSRLFEHHKRVGDVVRAVALLKDTLPELRLIIVGQGPDEGMLRKLVAELRVSNQVIFAGYQAVTRPYFDCFDVFIHVPASEAFGLVVTEAMMAARPVIASRVGGIPQIILDGETGLLVSRYDPSALANAVGSLASDPERRSVMGRAGKARAQQLYSQERYVRDVATLYSELKT